jgi:putative acetyltransferase
MNLIRTDSSHPDFVNLVKLLDQYLAEADGEEHAFYHQYNGIEQLNQVVIGYENEQAVACGAMKAWGLEIMEIKRMYTLPSHRGKGFASQVLQGLEAWARELGAKACVLETGKRQAAALQLYPKNGYLPIPNFGPYQGIENSICFQKQLTNSPTA